MKKALTASRTRMLRPDEYARNSGATVNTRTVETGRTASPPNKESKTFRVIALLKRPHGASLEELVAETGWQPHTTRAALTGLRKNGHGITSNRVDGVRRYRADASK